MDEAKIADTKPCVLELEAGDYFWCSCGLSASQPFCDGSHKGTGFTPKKVTIDEAKKVALCACKRTGNGAFCDGSHAKLD
jgi:CDGSH-type Zn-finger protein